METNDLQKRIDRVSEPTKDEPAGDYITWETFFMDIAKLSKERSTNEKYKVNKCNHTINDAHSVTGWSMCSVTI